MKAKNTNLRKKKRDKKRVRKHELSTEQKSVDFGVNTVVQRSMKNQDVRKEFLEMVKNTMDYDLLSQVFQTLRFYFFDGSFKTVSWNFDGVELPEVSNAQPMYEILALISEVLHYLAELYHILGTARNILATGTARSLSLENRVTFLSQELLSGCLFSSADRSFIPNMIGELSLQLMHSSNQKLLETKNIVAEIQFEHQRLLTKVIEQDSALLLHEFNSNKKTSDTNHELALLNKTVKKLKSLLLKAKRENDSLSNQISTQRRQEDLDCLIKSHESKVLCLTQNLNIKTTEFEMIAKELAELKETARLSKENHEYELQLLKRDHALSQETNVILQEKMQQLKAKISTKQTCSAENSIDDFAEKQRLHLLINKKTIELDAAVETIKQLQSEKAGLIDRLTNQDKLLERMELEACALRTTHEERFSSMERTLNDQLRLKSEEADRFKFERDEAGEKLRDLIAVTNSIQKNSTPDSSLLPSLPVVVVMEQEKASNNSSSTQNVLERILGDTAEYRDQKTTQLVESADELVDAETENLLLREQNELLKGEIRRLDENLRRYDMFTDLESVKNLFVKFVSSTAEEQESILPTIATTLQLAREDTAKLRSFIEEQSGGILRNSISSITGYVGKWL